ncbi:MAG: type II toxin-antitoxin system VapC family toxin [Pseudomonadota bacterium]
MVEQDASIYMLDTNICIYIMKHHPPQVRERLIHCPVGNVMISSIVLAELWYGVTKSKQQQQNTMALNDFLAYCRVEPWPQKAAIIYGEIRIDLERKGKLIGGNDLLIAAHAKSLDCTLVTNNLNEFNRVNCLQVENWI